MIDPREGNSFNDNLFDRLDNLFIERYGDKGRQWLSMQEDIDPDDMIWQYVTEAFVVAFNAGYSQARQDDYEYNEEIDQENWKHLVGIDTRTGELGGTL